MALPLPRVIPDKDIQQNFDELANQFPIQAANIGAGQVKAPAVGSQFGLLASSGTYTFSGLNGDAEYGYELIGDLTFPTAMTGNGMLVCPNGTGGTAYDLTRHVVDSGSTHAMAYTSGLAGLVIPLTSGGANDRISFQAILFAKTGFRRTLLGTSGMASSGGARWTYQYQCGWSDTSTNITSIQFQFPGAGSTVNGWISLRKLGV